MALIDKLTAIADAIRGKTGKADPLTLEQMATEIEGIEAGGGKASSLFVAFATDKIPNQIVSEIALNFETELTEEVAE